MFLSLSLLAVALGPTSEAAVVPAAGADLQVSRRVPIQRAQLRRGIRGRLEDVKHASFAQELVQYGHKGSDRQALVQGIPEGDTPKGPVPERRLGLHFRRVSTTLYCVMILTIVSLLIHTALSISRNSEELAGQTLPTITTQTLSAAARIIAYPRMICMLFVGCRMYVLATTEGTGEPPPWVKACMITATVGVLVQMFSVLAVPFFAEKISKDAGITYFEYLAGEQDDTTVMLQPFHFQFEIARRLFRAIQLLTTICIYGGVSGIILGLLTFPAQTTKVSAAVTCTIIMSTVYLLVLFLQWFANQWLQYSGPPTLKSSRVRQAGLQAVFCARKAPCLAVLFLAARMRALQLDPPLGHPSVWVQASFYAVTAAFGAEILAGIYIGAKGDEQLSSMHITTFRAGKVAHMLSSLFSFIVYCGVIPIFAGIFVMKDENGQRAHLSATLTCLLQLTFAYFAVHLMQWFIFLLRDVFDIDWKKCQSTVSAADVSLRFAPMLSILFLSCRMRALQITQQRGSPPVWAQQSMYLCVLAMTIQSVSCLVLPFFLDATGKVDGDGMPQFQLRPMVGAYAVSFMKYVALFCLNGGVLAICFSVFTMTPDTAVYGEQVILTTELEFDTCLNIFFIFIICLLLSSAKMIGILVKVTIESLDQKLLGTDITIDSVAISLCRVYINIRKLEVQNPPFQGLQAEGDWVSTCIMKMHSLILKVNVWRVIRTLGKEVEVTRLEISGVEVNYEKPWRKTANVQMVLDHLHSPTEDGSAHQVKDVKKPDEKETGKEETKPEAAVADTHGAEEKKQKPYTTVIVKTLNISNIDANVMLGGPMGLGGMITLPLDDLPFPNFDKATEHMESKAMVAVVAKFILKTLLKTVISMVGMGMTPKSLVNAGKTLSDCCPSMQQIRGAATQKQPAVSTV